jgi:hypothetical protein
LICFLRFFAEKRLEAVLKEENQDYKIDHSLYTKRKERFSLPVVDFRGKVRREETSSFCYIVFELR